jgi:hypothetical protein
MSFDLASFGKTILADAEGDEFPVLLQLLGNLGNGMAGNLSAVNISAQLVSFEAGLIAAQGKIGPTLFGQINALVQAELTALAAEIQASTAGATGATGTAPSA